MDTSESRRKEFREIYEHLCDKPRFRPHHVAKDLGLRPSSVGLRLKEAVEKGIHRRTPDQKEVIF